jgi:hypothetical protein
MALAIVVIAAGRTSSTAQEAKTSEGVPTQQQNPQLRSVMHETQISVIRKIKTTSEKPRGAMLAYIALGGLNLLEILDFHSWPKAERLQLLSDIEWLVDVEPEMPVSAGEKTKNAFEEKRQCKIRQLRIFFALCSQRGW